MKFSQGPESNFVPISPQHKLIEPYKHIKHERAKYKLENAIDKKAKRINVQRKLGIWECLKIYGTPEEIKEELKFTWQMDTSAKCAKEAKFLLNELKK